MQIKLANYAMEDQRDFKRNLMLLSEIIYATAAEVSPETMTQKQNNFQLPKWKLRMKKKGIQTSNCPTWWNE